MSLFKVTKKQVIENYELRTMTGDIVSFIPSYSQLLPDPFSDLNVTVNIVATGGNGTPDNPNPIVGFTEANITRCGVNLCFNAYGDKANAGTYLYPSGDNLPIIVNNTLRTAYAYVGKNADVVISFADVPQRSIAYGLEGYPELGTICHALTVTALTTKSFKVNSGNYEYIAFYYCNDSGNIPSDCQIEKGSTATAYTPYNGNTYAIAFGQTVYGGVLDVTRGKLHVTHGKYTLDNTATAGQFDINTYADRNRISYVPYQSDGKTNGTFKADKLETAPNAPGGIGTGDYQIFGSTTAPHLWITVPTTIATVADFLTYISSNPIEVVYELATPIDIDLTPEVISAVVGTNNVFADCGQTTVTCLI